ncbi:hypothetical protein ACQVP2_34705 [Methylobacterium aquaticum]|uniref:hypothetical protein n=1 Tax=Methylobacterium aquaticum TaxID=270351 RepID=UPI003D16D1F8
MRGWRLFAVLQPGEAARLAPNKAAQLAGIMRENLDLLERAHDPIVDDHDRRDQTIAELEVEMNALIVEFVEVSVIMNCLLDRIAELEAQSDINNK